MKEIKVKPGGRANLKFLDYGEEGGEVYYIPELGVEVRCILIPFDDHPDGLEIYTRPEKVEQTKKYLKDRNIPFEAKDWSSFSHIIIKTPNEHWSPAERYFRIEKPQNEIKIKPKNSLDSFLIPGEKYLIKNENKEYWVEVTFESKQIIDSQILWYTFIYDVVWSYEGEELLSMFKQGILVKSDGVSEMKDNLPIYRVKDDGTDSSDYPEIYESVNLSKILKEIEFSQYQIYCDMDSVLTDFPSRYEHFTGMLPDEMEAELTKQYGKEKAKAMFWEKVDHLGTKFWTGIPWMKDGHMLWNYIRKYNPILLSSPSRSQTSVEGKKLWVDKYLPGTELILRQANKKQEFAGPKNILIDDRADNIQQWIAKGGIGILHKSASDTIHQLKELGFDNINEIKIKPASINNEDAFINYFFFSENNQENNDKILKEWNTFYHLYNKYWKGKPNESKPLFRNNVNLRSLIKNLVELGKIPSIIPFNKDTIPKGILTDLGREYNLELPKIKDIVNAIPEVEKSLKILMYRFHEEIIRNGKSILIDRSNIKSITDEEVVSFAENNQDVKEVFNETGRHFLNEDNIKEITANILKQEWTIFKDFDVEQNLVKGGFNYDRLEKLFLYILDKNYQEIFDLIYHRFLEDSYDNMDFEEIGQELEKQGALSANDSYELENYEPYQELLIKNLKNIEGKELNEIEISKK
jgi:hypothetical protein